LYSKKLNDVFVALSGMLKIDDMIALLYGHMLRWSLENGPKKPLNIKEGVHLRESLELLGMK